MKYIIIFIKVNKKSLQNNLFFIYENFNATVFAALSKDFLQDFSSNSKRGGCLLEAGLEMIGNDFRNKAGRTIHIQDTFDNSKISPCIFMLHEISFLFSLKLHKLLPSKLTLCAKPQPSDGF